MLTPTFIIEPKMPRALLRSTNPGIAGGGTGAKSFEEQRLRRLEKYVKIIVLFLCITENRFGVPRNARMESVCVCLIVIAIFCII